MFILSTGEMNSIDKRAIEDYGIPAAKLMENAGKAVAKSIEGVFVDIKSAHVIVACGRGNNGGDGFVIARLLAEKGAKAYVCLCCSEEEIKGEAQKMLNKLPSDVERISLSQGEEMCFDIGVDAIFGTGFKGIAQGEYERGINLINKAKTVFAVDIPSGIEGDTGDIQGVCVHADYTITFCMEKLCHRMYPGKDYYGKLKVCDIGIPEQAVCDQRPMHRIFTMNDANLVIKPPHPTFHKGDKGKLLIIGGSQGMAGSICLSARAAMRSGVGLCYVAMPRNIYPITAAKLDEQITIPLRDDGGKLAEIAAQDICAKVAEKSYDAVVIGCGMGVSEGTRGFLKQVLKSIDVPVVLDADALTILAENSNMARYCPLILTPHTGEMARLMGMTAVNVDKKRVETAKECAKKYNAIVVLKGNATIITNGEEVYINSTGNPGMATAGSGDVLSGVIGAFLAGKIPPFKAAACGVFIHGMAGDYAVAKRSLTGIIASDIIDQLPYCLP